MGTLVRLQLLFLHLLDARICSTHVGDYPGMLRFGTGDREMQSTLLEETFTDILHRVKFVGPSLIQIHAFLF